MEDAAGGADEAGGADGEVTTEVADDVEDTEAAGVQTGGEPTAAQHAEGTERAGDAAGPRRADTADGHDGARVPANAPRAAGQRADDAGDAKIAGDVGAGGEIV